MLNGLSLPTFIIGGAQKAGTTALHAMLSQHPAIWMPSNPQETHFFDLEENYGMGVDWYKQQFFHAPNGRVVGQTSPLYLFLAKVPDRIATILPNVKLIFILRNPIDRAYSHYWHSWKKNREYLSFSAALKAEEKRLTRSFCHLRNYSYITRGKYFDQLCRYFDRFTSDQIHIIIYEEMKADPWKKLQETFDFLGVERFPGIDFRKKVNVTVIPRSRLLQRILVNRLTSHSRLRFVRQINAALNIRKGYPSMSAEIRERLVETFAEDNQKLGKLLGKNLSCWER